MVRRDDADVLCANLWRLAFSEHLHVLHNLSHLLQVEERRAVGHLLVLSCYPMKDNREPPPSRLGRQVLPPTKTLTHHLVGTNLKLIVVEELVGHAENVRVWAVVLEQLCDSSLIVAVNASRIERRTCSKRISRKQGSVMQIDVMSVFQVEASVELIWQFCKKETAIQIIQFILNILLGVWKPVVGFMGKKGVNTGDAPWRWNLFPTPDVILKCSEL